MAQEWIDIEISDISEVFLGKTPKKSDYTNSGNYKIIKFRDVSYQGICWSTNDQGFVLESKISDLKELQKNDILITSSAHSSAHIGKKITYVKALPSQFSKVFFVGELLNIRVNSKFANFKLAYYYFLSQTAYKHIQDLVKGVHLTSGEAKKIPYFIIPILEQNAIVAKIEELFSELDNGIENLKTALAKLKIYRQAVLKKAFEGEFTREWRERQTDLPTAEELLETIKQERKAHYQQQVDEWKSAVKQWEQSGDGTKPAKPKKTIQMPELKIDEIQKLPQIPTNWFYDYLAYAGELGRGKSKHRPRNDKKLFDGAYPFIQTAEVKAAGTKEILEYSKTYNDFGLAQSKLWPKGTLCITIAANIAETAFLGMDACFPDSVVGYKPFSKIIDPRYIDYFFKATKAKISAYAPATAQKNINLTTLENLIIPFCSLQEQSAIVQEIESRLSVCDKIEETITNSLVKAESLRQSILKKAFEGNLLTSQELEAIRNHPDYESAEELLKRIKQERK